MKTILMAAFSMGMAVSACTFAIHDPAEFERQATHVTRTYQVPMEPLFNCVARENYVTSSWQSYTAGDRAYVGWKGLADIEFTKTDKGTSVRISALEGGDPTINTRLYAASLDGCAASVK